MTPQEFKAWFQGFTEELEAIPNEKQWEKIKKRVSEIDGKPVTEYIYHNNYYPYYSSSWPPATPLPNRIVYLNSSANSGLNMNYNMDANNSSGGSGGSGSLPVTFDNKNQNFDSCSAMYSLGKTEFLG